MVNMININEWVKCFNNTGKLPEKNVYCTVCNTPVTMWSTNLTNRLKKYKSIKDLLQTFTCRGCQKPTSKPTSKPIVKSPVIIKEKKPIVETKPIVVKEITNKPTYEKGRQAGSVIIDLVKDAEYCSKHTREGGCWRPDIYLNSDRSCDKCMLYTNCRASCRRLSHEKKRKSNEEDK